ncbi:MAG: Flp pilus assembly complex ATPase component TadA [Candidatus Goldbacteria bacterium]|nr:Flp pilus assembly complex ATPase component TadA [Candidatus Goldiibacteriota bacterium]
MAKRLGELLLDENLVTEEQIKKALEEQQKTGEPLGRILVRMGFITEDALFYFIAIQYGLEYVDISNIEIEQSSVDIIKKEIAEELNIIPIEASNNRIVFATSEPDEHLLTRIQERIVLPTDKIKFVITSESNMRNALSTYYGVSEKFKEDTKLQEIFKDNAKEGAIEDEDVSIEDDNITEDSAPVIKLTNAFISEAVKKRASDIHLNPYLKNMVVRYRIDGVLQTQKSPPKHFRDAIVSRIKVMAKMDIMEKRAAQDGRIKIKVQNKIIDLRVSVLPTIYGENVVMRILDQEGLMLDLTKLGFEPFELEIYKEAIQSPYGLILHTGPTGSGKTTTLYSALSTVNDVSKNIITLEDPVEYQLPGIVQIQINHEIGFDFSSALRAVLRQDPNIIMVGEIRDSETADIAIKAALTGHLLFSTLHTNDAPSTIIRLIDMGVDPVYVGSAVRLIVAQRLLRKICPNCKKEYEPNEDELQKIQIKREQIEEKVYVGEGCPNCSGSGYKGRIAIYEILPMTQTISDMVFRRANLSELTEQAIKEGMRPLRSVAIEKWKHGITTIDEIIRVTTEGD